MLESEISETAVIVGAAALRPVKEAVGFFDGKVIDTRVADRHQSVGVELPVLVAVGTKPLAGGVMRLISEAHRDAIPVEGPKFFDEPVLKLVLPLASEKGDDLLPTVDKLTAITPATVDGVSERYLLRVARVPAVFRFAYLFDCCLTGEGGNGGRCSKTNLPKLDVLNFVDAGEEQPSILRGCPSRYSPLRRAHHMDVRIGEPGHMRYAPVGLCVVGNPLVSDRMPTESSSGGRS